MNNVEKWLNIMYEGVKPLMKNVPIMYNCKSDDWFLHDLNIGR